MRAALNILLSWLKTVNVVEQLSVDDSVHLKFTLLLCMCHFVIKNDRGVCVWFLPLRGRVFLQSSSISVCFFFNVSVWSFGSVLYVHVCCPSFSVLIWTCVVWSRDGSRSFGKRVWVACVLGVRCGCRRKAALFLHLCVCLNVSVCGVVKGWKRASVHMGTNDRIWFSEPACKEEKKMKGTKLVKNQRRDLARPPTEISLQRQMVSRRSPVFSLHLLNSYEPPQSFWTPPLLLNTWQKGNRYKPNLGLLPNNPWGNGEQTRTTKLPSFTTVTA